MMKTTWKVILTVILLAAFVDGYAMPLCAPPLDADCIYPQWGEFDPSGLSSDSLSSKSVGNGAMAQDKGMAIHMTTAAYTPPSRKSAVAPKVIVDDGKKFEPQTKALVAAIERASFDKEGKFVKGGEAISAAATKVQQVSAGYQLNLYLKARSTLKPDAAAAIGRKVTAINEVLGSSKAPAK
jgi:hypothetical protein